MDGECPCVDYLSSMRVVKFDVLLILVRYYFAMFRRYDASR